jgi:hypothetical protein
MYVTTTDSYAMYYLATTDPRGAMGLGGKDDLSLSSMVGFITALSEDLAVSMVPSHSEVSWHFI